MMKYYATDGVISQQPIEGGIEISREQYLEALAGIAQGHIVTIEGGFAVGPKPEPEKPEPEPEPEEPSVPEQVSRAQGKAALIIADLWTDVLTYVEAITDPTEKALAEVALNDTTHWRRDSPTMQAISTALGIASEQMDDLFIQASQVSL